MTETTAAEERHAELLREVAELKATLRALTGESPTALAAELRKYDVVRYTIALGQNRYRFAAIRNRRTWYTTGSTAGARYDSALRFAQHLLDHEVGDLYGYDALCGDEILGPFEPEEIHLS